MLMKRDSRLNNRQQLNNDALKRQWFNGREYNDLTSDWPRSSKTSGSSSSASSECSKSTKTRRHWNLEKNLRNVLRYPLREGFEGISYTRPIPSDTCGRQHISPKFSERILGGFEAVAHSWPWQVLYEQSGTCGGTLIDENYVLTAAHCISTKDPSLITITAGIHNRDLGDVDESSRQKLQVAKIFVHPDWNADTVINDIALLRLAEPANFNEYVQPACLPGPDPKPDSEVVLIGWGAVETGGGTHHVLKQTQVRVIENCEHFWTDINKEKQICVRDPSLNSVVCNGDSGGPLLQEHSGQWVVDGVTSFGERECEMVNHNMPNVYTRVSAYLPWINGIMDK
ncbi:unnamed protein product [Rotaria socialis]